MRQLWYLIMVFILLSLTVYAGDESPVTPEQDEPLKSEKAAYVEISDTPQKASETLAALQDIQDILTEKEAILEMHAVLPSYMESIQTMLVDPVYKHLDTQDLKSIDDLRQKWIVYLKQLQEWEKLIQERLVLYDKHKSIIAELTRLWSETHIRADQEQAPVIIQNHIASVLVKIESLNTIIQSNYNMLITDAQLISDGILRIKVKIEQLQEARSTLLSDIFVVDSASIIALIQTTPLNISEYVQNRTSSLKAFYQNLQLYVVTNIKDLYTLIGYAFVIFMMTGYLYLLNQKGRLFTQGESAHDTQFAFIGKPVSTAVILTVFVSVFVFTDRSEEFKNFQILIIIIPVIRLLAKIVHKRFMPYIYTYFIFHLIYFFEERDTGYGLTERLLALALIVALLVLVCLVLRQKKYIEKAGNSVFLRYSTPFFLLVCSLLGMAFITNVYGTVALSDRIATVVFITLSVILIFYILIYVLSGLVVIFVRRRIAQSRDLLQVQSPRLERNVTGLITLIMTVWWFVLMVETFGFKESLLEWGSSVLAYSWQFGAMTFSVEGIFNFFVIMTFTWLIARAMRIFLTLALFARFKFPRGVQTAISTISNHTIFIIGIIVAFSTLGITTQEFALIGGALGVGIGFGIRNIVANFISGLIMLFERPVQIGDTIEINKTIGSVQAIGTRATSIRTFDGSEVLIPNADFISSDVTNWTLTDDRRRATLLIKVDFDSDIEEVLKIMDTVASEHQHVLDDPAPMATFEGFGDYYLEFKLYYWLSDEIIRTKSDVAIGIFNSLKAHKIKIPTPTRSISIHDAKNETEN